ncbi:hypothetical protein ACIQ64_35650 [Streptomyces sp. NPDC094473]|uniref:hypothetical protein n=1 Tax=Streptomyces sp. NPDC094473 TaxID=3366068 RepID=UPI00382BCBF0
MADVMFRSLQPWAVVPDKSRIDRAKAREERDAYAQSFRYLRVPRLPADCPPWVLGQELGWSIHSPISVTMSPLDDLGVAVPAEENIQKVGHRLGRAGLWQRGEDWLATKDTDWLHLGDYRGQEGGWEGMFVPNGHGTVEWRLGWSARVPEHTFLMVMPLPLDGLEVPLGVIAAKTVNAMTSRGGMSIAVRPTRPVTLHRGQAVARLVLLHADTLRATATHTTGPEPEAEPGPEATTGTNEATGTGA